MKSLSFNYLVIEDDTNVWGNIERRMQKFEKWTPVGFCSEITDSLEKISVHQPNLIFSDWSIKGGNAFEILNFIKSIDNYCPYVIFFTGFQSDFPQIPQEIHNNYPIVRKYIVKPIFENLTENLSQYINEAEAQFLSQNKVQEIFLENELKQQIKIKPKDIIAVIQCEENPRRKEIYFFNAPKINTKQTWEKITALLEKFNVDYHICYHRKSIVNKKFISKINKPYIWTENGIKIKVTRDCWIDF